MARRRGTRRLTHPSGVARPLDGVADVGPSGAPAPETTVPSAAPAVPGESLEDRQERWYRERDRYERRRAGEPDPKVEPT
ncbi:MAG: hypothetical protein L3K00_01355 [Thermoplasmata archaeon]|nr:hypothetical protein [Thermoplasmata archaeon]MCI4362397.1 hypothetical protein [Thermoplasmata archaeon]